MARVIAADGERLLAAVDAATDQPVLAQLPAVVTLRRVWAEQYTGEPGQLRWREVKDMPSPAGLISSPYDTEARYSTKREVEWVGYKVHLTETCDEDRPHLIVNVETTPATTPDDNMIEVVHESEERRDLLPGEHLVDKGYTDSEVLVDSQREYGVTIVGPVAEDPELAGACRRGLRQGELRGGLGPSGGDLPGGQGEHLLAAEHLPEERHGLRGAVRAEGLHAVSVPVAVHEGRSRSRGSSGCCRVSSTRRCRRPAASRRTEEFRSRYAARAGIEGTHEQAIRRCGLRRCRYIGEAKAHLQHLLTAAAINLVRLSDWWAGTPLSRTRCSRFAALQPAA